MSMREFVRRNRADLDRIIDKALGSPRKRDDREREMWVLNDEGLYQWARREGCKI